ncbi:helix-turn-helix transcriptional regulator [Salinimicrobium oceani]|uniref:Helix-turn-helix transcriptional regulator n=1 Tax=Salinimicrobium oceani TaxID=2722702 RepID=A0ABX1CW56_9FLAO|nr:helix-turn-helix transcriptional regulator [Salinimicrobium oceani]NJW52521.1 helix-turn-helix transcriptional regulator [Salinimicrobium oceani]
MKLEEKIKNLTPDLERMPGVVVIHEIEGFKPVYMSRNGLELLEMELEALLATGADYSKKFLSNDFMESYLAQLKEMLEREGNDETFTFFHEVKIKVDFRWYAGSMKMFHSRSGVPTHTITFAVPLEEYQWTIKRAKELLKEKHFARKNLEKFSSLSRREKEVLSLSATGNKAAQISDELKVSQDTVNSHLKSLKSKLNTSSSYEMLRFAKAYDLI